METKSAVMGAAGSLLVVGLAFGFVATANAENAPEPVVTTSGATSVAPTQEPYVSASAPEPTVSTPVADPAPVVVEPVAPGHTPVVVAPAPVATGYVQPEPAPSQNGVVNAPAAPDDIKNTGRGAQPTDGSTAIIQR